MSKVLLSLFLIFIAILVSLLAAYIIMSIARLYEIGFLTQFTFVQIYGLICILSILNVQYKDYRAKGFSRMYEEAMLKFFATSVTLLVFWAVCIGMYYVLV